MLEKKLDYTEELDSFLNTALIAAKSAGAILVDYMGRVSVNEKAPRDLVTEADVASQKRIREILLGRFPNHQFVGEEDENHDFSEENQLTWIVDPLDGTTNFVHQLRSFSVSICLVSGRTPIVGVVFDPLCDECYFAKLGEGAYLNHQQIRVSECQNIHHALLATGFTTSVTKDSIEAARFLEILGKAQAIRRLGSAALNLCYLASGRVDGYWATGIKAWDVAAGMLIMQEAGGQVRGIDGPFDLLEPRFVASSTRELGDQIEELLDNAG